MVEVAQGAIARILQFLMSLVEMAEYTSQLVKELGAGGTFDVLGRREAVVGLKLIEFES